MNMALRKKRGAVPVEYRDIPFTPERIKQLSEADVEVGGDDRTGRRYRVKDWVEKLKDNKKITFSEYAALMKYHHHWHHGGLQSNLKSPDLNRVFASDAGGMTGLARNEYAAHHRKQYHIARELLGHRLGIVVDNIVCNGHPLEVAGFSIGYASLYRARMAATEMMRDAGYRLAVHWGIG